MKALGLSLSLFLYSLPSYAAPVDLRVAVDLECPFSVKAIKETLPEIEKKYGDKVKITIHSMPLSFHRLNEKASVAGICATEQEVFLPFVQALSKTTWKTNEMDSNYLERVAVQVAHEDRVFDISKFQKCLQSPKHLEKVRFEKKEMEKAGAKGTPTFWVEDKILVGNQKASLLALIDQKLAAR